MTNKEIYLGDGLYGSFDGFQIKLRAPIPGGDHIVYLEPSICASLLDFIEKSYPGLLQSRLDGLNIDHEQ